MIGVGGCLIFGGGGLLVHPSHRTDTSAPGIVACPRAWMKCAITPVDLGCLAILAAIAG